MYHFFRVFCSIGISSILRIRVALNLRGVLHLRVVILVTLALQVLLCVSIIGQVLLPAAFCIVCGGLLGLGIVLTRR